MVTRNFGRALACLSLCLILLASCGCSLIFESPYAPAVPLSLAEVPPFDGEAYAVLENNQPTFTEDEIVTVSFEYYEPLDAQGRCGVTMACIGQDLMPTDERGEIGSIKPSGWHNKPYDFVDGRYVYNRCHLIGWQLAGENANEQNLITGTRYLNTQGMLPFENMVADYIHETSNHVMYRVIPVFEGDELVARGVTIEAYSVEDRGEGICFYVYCYNVQPGVIIDYATGENELDLSTAPGSFSDAIDGTYVLNTSSKRIHLPSCDAASSIKSKNRRTFSGNPKELLADGYSYCGSCFD